MQPYADKTPLIRAQKIDDRLKVMAQEISADYQEKNPVLVTLLKGSLYFAADLTRKLSLTHSLDFMSVAQDERGAAQVKQAPTGQLEGRHVLLLEDIIDSGLTMRFILSYLEEKGAASLAIASLLDNPARRLVDLPLTYVGFTIPDVYVVGYGLDLHQAYRNLIHIYPLEDADLEIRD